MESVLCDYVACARREPLHRGKVPTSRHAQEYSWTGTRKGCHLIIFGLILRNPSLTFPLSGSGMQHDLVSSIS